MCLPPQQFSAVVVDIIDALPSPMKETAKLVFRELMEKRAQQARDILIEEIRAGEKDVWEACDVDEVAAIVYRYMRAAQEGTARINLRLLARIIAGQKATKTLKADEFLYYADIIGSLRKEEILFLGSFCRELKKTQGSEETKKIGKDEKDWVREANKNLEALLVPAVFSNSHEFWSIASTIVRTGLLLVSYPTFDGPYFTLTPLFGKICSLASFEIAFEAEK